MKQVTIDHTRPVDIMNIVNEMRTAGMTQGKDFDFAYHNASYNNDGHEAVTPRHTVFTFYDDKWATFFILRWI
jgi:hypothetical protein